MKTAENLCMACEKQHMWAVVHPKYINICGVCVEEDARVDWDEEEQCYALFGYCHCDRRGPVNYGRHDTEYHYYCGGSLSTCRP